MNNRKKLKCLCVFEERGPKTRVSKIYYLKYSVFINNNKKIGDMERNRKILPIIRKTNKVEIKTVHEYDYILE